MGAWVSSGASSGAVAGDTGWCYGHELCLFGGGVSTRLDWGQKTPPCGVDGLLSLAAELREEGESVEDSRRLAGGAVLYPPLDN